MNKYYSYPGIETWKDDTWADRGSPCEDLFTWIIDNYEGYYQSHRKTIDDTRWKDFLDRGYYNSTTASIDAPSELEYWEKKGIRFECRHLGGTKWVSMVPVKAYQDRSKRLPALIVLHQESYSDPQWPMKTIGYYHDYNEMAARNDFIVVYPVTEGVNLAQIPNIILETCDLFPTDIDRIYLDLTSVIGSGHRLSEVFSLKGEIDGAVHLDARVEKFGPLGIPALNISRIWQKRDGMYPFLVNRMRNQAFDMDRLVHSQTGRKMAEATLLELEYNSPADPELLEMWKDMGVRYEAHDCRGERWISMAPRSAYEDRGKKLPVMIVMQEVGYCNEHLVLTAFSQFYEYCQLAAQGDLIAIFFAREAFDLNEMLTDILDDAERQLPVDRTSVYITGHSHNGRYALDFAVRHPDLITAVATLGNSPGLDAPDRKALPDPPGMKRTKITFETPDERIDYMGSLDLPLVNISGYCEMTTMFPYNKGNPYPSPGPQRPDANVDVRIAYWQRRLKASNCPMKTAEEIMAAAESDDAVSRLLGINSDKSEIVYADGAEHYIADIRNKAGRLHLRMIGIENMPHMPTPFMNTLVWSFVRRFARDPETGAIIERY